ncbi:MAG: metallophosphoesterase [Proteobacteria bacterium]|nr:metallophosphoesterase [Pseudomonadota bacterium]
MRRVRTDMFLDDVLPPGGKARAQARAVWASRRVAIEGRTKWHGGGKTVRNAVLRSCAWLFVRAALLTGAWRRGRRNARRPQIDEIDFALRDLPTVFDGLRIVQISDIHAGERLHDLGPLARALAGVEADIGVITGDFAPDSGRAFALDGVVAALAQARVRHGWMATLGNHDRHALVDALETAGIRVLANETVALRHRDEALYFTGLDDVRHFRTELSCEHLAGVPPDGVRIALVHSAGFAREAAALGFDVYLCGHTHGGQICFPGGRPIVMDGVPRSFARGAWRCEGMAGYTNRGLGTTMIPLRFNCPPEISIIRLRRA